MRRLASDISIAAIVEGRTLDEARSFANEIGLHEAETILDERATIARYLEVQERPAAAIVQDFVAGDVATVRDIGELETFIRLSQARRDGNGRSHDGDLSRSAADRGGDR
jgi:hypothetical protein